jgi:DNA end-binding protein Ku
MAKSIWNGDISFGLVSIPVSLVSTEERHELHFHLLNAKTKARVHYKRIDESTGKEVAWADVVKGYEYEKDQYVVVNDEAFEKASPELFKTIDIEAFVDLHEIDSLYYKKPYYLVPNGKNKKAYVLLREALRQSNKVGVAKAILRTKEYLSLILAHEHALLLYLIHFKEDLRPESEINLPKDELKAYKISDKELKMAEHLIKEMSISWQPEKYHNEYQATLEKWLDQQTKALMKSDKKTSQVSKSHEGVVDFIALLKQSMKKSAGHKKVHRLSSR